MATWQLQAQLQNSTTLDVDTTEHIWWTGSTFGSSVAVNAYQDGTHIADSNDIQQDTVSAVHNTKYIDSTHVSIDNGGNTSLPIATGSCGLLFTFSDPSSVTTASVLFYAYDGVNDINPMAGVTIQAAEGGQSTTWVAANGFGSALQLQNQTTATTHHFYIATSISPTSSGLKSGKIKIVLTYT